MRTMNNGVRIELAKLWRENVRKIIGLMPFGQCDIAKEMGFTSQSFTHMLNNKDFHLTNLQFFSSMFVLKEMIVEADVKDFRIKEIAEEALHEIYLEYKENGIY